MSVIDWALYSERAVGRGSLTYTDVINRPLREVLTASGQDPDASFPGFSLAGHTHDASAIVSGIVAPARGGTGLSSPTAGGLLVAAAAAAMTLLAPGASGQVVRSTGSAWASSPIVTADVSDLASAATGITRLGTVTTGAWQASPINDTYLATIGTAGKVANTATTAASANTPSAIVARDASGNFAAGVITATFTGALTGNASTATKLAAAVNINGVAFDGSGNVTVPAAANTLTGTTLAANVVASSLTGVGTLTSGTWSATLIAPAFGGTGVSNANTITVGGNVNTAAAFTTVGGPLTFTLGGATNVTLPTSGTLVNTAVLALPSLSTVGTLTSLIVAGTAVFNGGSVNFSNYAGTAKIVGGTSGISLRSNLDNADNLLITDAGVVTVRAGLTVSAGTTAVQALAATAGTFSSTLGVTGAVNFASAVAVAGALSASLVTLSNALQLPGSNAAGLQARNAANTAYIDLLFMNASDVAVIPRAAIVSSGLTVTTGGITVSAGTTAVQSLTATTGVFSGGVATISGSVNPNLRLNDGTGDGFVQVVAGDINISPRSGKAFTVSSDFNIGAGKFVVAGSNGNSTIAGTLGVTGAVTMPSSSVTQAAAVTLTIASTASNDAYVEMKGTNTVKNWRVGKDITVGNAFDIQASASNGGTDYATVFSLSNAGALTLGSSIKTSNPTTGTASPWKLGSRVAATVALVTSQYIELDVNGTLYKLATVS